MNAILPSIMQSIKPFHCENIATGRKGFEVRKTKPNIPTPFKGYIYCTKDKEIFYQSRYRKDFILYKPKFYKDTEILLRQNGHTVFNGKVIGEYICDEIQEWVFDNETNSYDISDDDLALTCLTQEQLWEYGKGKTLYGYHISNLKIYDEPKELNKFYTICNKDDLDQCGDCKYIESYSASFPCEDGGGWWCSVDNKKPLTRPPQSWCYCGRYNMAEIVFEIKIENEKMQECVNEALYEYKTKSGLTVAECVERQIPKKPIEKSIIGKLKIPDIAYCPICDNPVIKDESDNYEQSYCCYCGQALDWA